MVLVVYRCGVESDLLRDQDFRSKKMFRCDSNRGAAHAAIKREDLEWQPAVNVKRILVDLSNKRVSSPYI